MTNAVITNRQQFGREILKNFSSRVNSYDAHAQIHQFAARQLTEYISRWEHATPSGPLLEVGCGTGVLTEQLLSLYPNKSIVVSDISNKMLDRCQQKMESLIKDNACRGEVIPRPGDAWHRPYVNPNKLQFRILDAEKFESSQEFSIIASSFTFQWFHELNEVLSSFVNGLMIGGAIIFCVPSANSFPEWKEACKLANVPFTGNQLPAGDLFHQFAENTGQSLRIHSEHTTVLYESAHSFFRSLKELGASTSLGNYKLNYSEMKRLLDAWPKTNGKISVTYEMIYGQIIRIK